MVYINPTEYKLPKKFKIMCSSCGHDQGFVSEVHQQGSLILRCPECDAKELFKPY